MHRFVGYVRITIICQFCFWVSVNAVFPPIWACTNGLSPSTFCQFDESCLAPDGGSVHDLEGLGVTTYKTVTCGSGSTLTLSYRFRSDLDRDGELTADPLLDAFGRPQYMCSYAITSPPLGSFFDLTLYDVPAADIWSRDDQVHNSESTVSASDLRSALHTTTTDHFPLCTFLRDEARSRSSTGSVVDSFSCTPPWAIPPVASPGLALCELEPEVTFNCNQTRTTCSLTVDLDYTCAYSGVDRHVDFVCHNIPSVEVKRMMEQSLNQTSPHTACRQMALFCLWNWNIYLNNALQLSLTENGPPLRETMDNKYVSTNGCRLDDQGLDRPPETDCFQCAVPYSAPNNNNLDESGLFCNLLSTYTDVSLPCYGQSLVCYAQTGGQSVDHTCVYQQNQLDLECPLSGESALSLYEQEDRINQLSANLTTAIANSLSFPSPNTASRRLLLEEHKTGDGRPVYIQSLGWIHSWDPAYPSLSNFIVSIADRDVTIVHPTAVARVDQRESRLLSNTIHVPSRPVSAELAPLLQALNDPLSSLGPVVTTSPRDSSPLPVTHDRSLLSEDAVLDRLQTELTNDLESLRRLQVTTCSNLARECLGEDSPGHLRCQTTNDNVPLFLQSNPLSFCTSTLPPSCWVNGTLPAMIVSAPTLPPAETGLSSIRLSCFASVVDGLGVDPYPITCRRPTVVEYEGSECFYLCQTDTPFLTMTAFPVEASILLHPDGTDRTRCAYLRQVAIEHDDFTCRSPYTTSRTIVPFPDLSVYPFVSDDDSVTSELVSISGSDRVMTSDGLSRLWVDKICLRDPWQDIYDFSGGAFDLIRCGRVDGSLLYHCHSPVDPNLVGDSSSASAINYTYALQYEPTTNNATQASVPFLLALSVPVSVLADDPDDPTTVARSTIQTLLQLRDGYTQGQYNCPLSGVTSSPASLLYGLVDTEERFCALNVVSDGTETFQCGMAFLAGEDGASRWGQMDRLVDRGVSVTCQASDDDTYACSVEALSGSSVDLTAARRLTDWSCPTIGGQVFLDTAFNASTDETTRLLLQEERCLRLKRQCDRFTCDCLHAEGLTSVSTDTQTIARWGLSLPPSDEFWCEGNYQALTESSIDAVPLHPGLPPVPPKEETFSCGVKPVYSIVCSSEVELTDGQGVTSSSGELGLSIESGWRRCRLVGESDHLSHLHCLVSPSDWLSTGALDPEQDPDEVGQRLCSVLQRTCPFSNERAFCGDTCRCPWSPTGSSTDPTGLTCLLPASSCPGVLCQLEDDDGQHPCDIVPSHVNLTCGGSQLVLSSSSEGASIGVTGTSSSVVSQLLNDWGQLTTGGYSFSRVNGPQYDLSCRRVDTVVNRLSDIQYECQRLWSPPLNSDDPSLSDRRMSMSSCLVTAGQIDTRMLSSSTASSVRLDTSETGSCLAIGAECVRQGTLECDGSFVATEDQPWCTYPTEESFASGRLGSAFLCAGNTVVCRSGSGLLAMAQGRLDMPLNWDINSVYCWSLPPTADDIEGVWTLDESVSIEAQSPSLPFDLPSDGNPDYVDPFLGRIDLPSSGSQPTCRLIHVQHDFYKNVAERCPILYESCLHTCADGSSSTTVCEEFNERDRTFLCDHQPIQCRLLAEDDALATFDLESVSSSTADVLEAIRQRGGTLRCQSDEESVSLDLDCLVRENSFAASSDTCGALIAGCRVNDGTFRCRDGYVSTIEEPFCTARQSEVRAESECDCGVWWSDLEGRQLLPQAGQDVQCYSDGSQRRSGSDYVTEAGLDPTTNQQDTPCLSAQRLSPSGLTCARRGMVSLDDYLFFDDEGHPRSDGAIRAQNVYRDSPWKKYWCVHSRPFPEPRCAVRPGMFLPLCRVHCPRGLEARSIANSTSLYCCRPGQTSCSSSVDSRHCVLGQHDAVWYSFNQSLSSALQDEGEQESLPILDEPLFLEDFPLALCPDNLQSAMTAYPLSESQSSSSSNDDEDTGPRPQSSGTLEDRLVQLKLLCYEDDQCRGFSLVTDSTTRVQGVFFFDRPLNFPLIRLQSFDPNRHHYKDTGRSYHLHPVAQDEVPALGDWAAWVSTDVSTFEGETFILERTHGFPCDDRRLNWIDYLQQYPSAAVRVQNRVNRHLRHRQSIDSPAVTDDFIESLQFITNVHDRLEEIRQLQAHSVVDESGQFAFRRSLIVRLTEELDFDLVSSLSQGRLSFDDVEVLFRRLVLNGTVQWTPSGQSGGGVFLRRVGGSLLTNDRKILREHRQTNTLLRSAPLFGTINDDFDRTIRMYRAFPPFGAEFASAVIEPSATWLVGVQRLPTGTEQLAMTTFWDLIAYYTWREWVTHGTFTRGYDRQAPNRACRLDTPLWFESGEGPAAAASGDGCSVPRCPRPIDPHWDWTTLADDPSTRGPWMDEPFANQYPDPPEDSVKLLDGSLPCGGHGYCESTPLDPVGEGRCRCDGAFQVQDTMIDDRPGLFRLPRSLRQPSCDRDIRQACLQTTDSPSCSHRGVCVTAFVHRRQTSECRCGSFPLDTTLPSAPLQCHLVPGGRTCELHPTLRWADNLFSGQFCEVPSRGCRSSCQDLPQSGLCLSPTSPEAVRALQLLSQLPNEEDNPILDNVPVQDTLDSICQCSSSDDWLVSSRTATARRRWPMTCQSPPTGNFLNSGRAEPWGQCVEDVVDYCQCAEGRFGPQCRYVVLDGGCYSSSIEHLITTQLAWTETTCYWNAALGRFETQAETSLSSDEQATDGGRLCRGKVCSGHGTCQLIDWSTGHIVTNDEALGFMFGSPDHDALRLHGQTSVRAEETVSPKMFALMAGQTCSCRAGYSGPFCEERTCSTPCGVGSQCIVPTILDDVIPFCQCPVDEWGRPLSSGVTCEDEVCGGHGSLVNSDGPSSWTCQCDIGYFSDSDPSHKPCSNQCDHPDAVVTLANGRPECLCPVDPLQFFGQSVFDCEERQYYQTLFTPSTNPPVPTPLPAPVPTPTPIPSPVPSPTPSLTPVPLPMPSPTPSPTPIETPTPTTPTSPSLPDNTNTSEEADEVTGIAVGAASGVAIIGTSVFVYMKFGSKIASSLRHLF